MGFLDKVIRFFEELAGGRIDAPTQTQRRTEAEVRSEPESDDFGIGGGFRRKFVAGLVYCGGKKKTAFGLTFEDNDIDRESELLERIEFEVRDSCSDIRGNSGYSSEAGFEEQEPIWPEIEVGFE